MLNYKTVINYKIKSNYTITPEVYFQYPFHNIVLSSNRDSEDFLRVEDAFHDLVKEEYNYHILFDIGKNEISYKSFQIILIK